MTDRRTSLAAEKLNRLLFLKKNLRTLQQINEERSKQKTQQFKRKLSISDDESVSMVKDRSNSMSTATTAKTMEINDIENYSSEDIENILDESAEWI